jgi:hypothetical protein
VKPQAVNSDGRDGRATRPGAPVRIMEGAAAGGDEHPSAGVRGSDAPPCEVLGQPGHDLTFRTPPVAQGAQRQGFGERNNLICSSVLRLRLRLRVWAGGPLWTSSG